MKTFKKQSFQGDICIRAVKSIPKKARKRKPTDGRHVVAHSETGHHHTIPSDAEFWTVPDDPMVAYLRCQSAVPLEHHRAWDQHETIMIPSGTWEVRRQREHRPAGWVMVND